MNTITNNFNSNNKNMLLFISEQLKNLNTKFDNFELRLDNLETRFDNLEKVHKKLSNSMDELKAYVKKESDYYEYKVTYWLLNYLKNNIKSSVFYIPSDTEVPRDLFMLNSNSKKKTISDLDGVVIGTNNLNYQKKYSHIKNNNLITPIDKKESYFYDIYIIESKHFLTIKKIKDKIKQIILFKNIINDPNSPYSIRKFSTGKIFLYFSAPVINNQTLDFINNKLYLNNDYWKLNSKNIISPNDLLFLDNNIKFIISNNNNDDFNIS
jgi:hypothetical protein